MWHRSLAKWLTSGKADENITVENIAEYDQQRELVDMPTNGLITRYMLEGFVPVSIPAVQFLIPAGTTLTDYGNGVLVYRFDLTTTINDVNGNPVDLTQYRVNTVHSRADYKVSASVYVGKNVEEIKTWVSGLIRYIDYPIPDDDGSGVTTKDFVVTIWV